MFREIIGADIAEEKAGGDAEPFLTLSKFLILTGRIVSVGNKV